MGTRKREVEQRIWWFWWQAHCDGDRHCKSLAPHLHPRFRRDWGEEQVRFWKWLGLTIEEYQNLSVTLCVTLCVTQPSYASLNHLRQDIDFINNFDTIWSSKWLWSIIFSSESDYLDDKTFQHMHVTCLEDEISIGPQGLVCICAHPIYIWICWFGRFAFVKPSRQVISTLPLERRWISPKKSWIFQIQSSAFAVRWFIHICQSLLFSSLLINRNSFVQPIFTQPFLQSYG